MLTGVYTIPPGVAFLDCLAAGLLRELGERPQDLAKATILLPNRRARRALCDAFLRCSDGNALLLPRIDTLGDVDDDDLTLLDAAGNQDPELPPPLSPLRRRLLLATLLGPLQRDLSMAEQTARAGDLMRLLDGLYLQERGLDDLDDIVPAAFAEHWQRILRFLDILKSQWPALLAAEEAMEPAQWQIQMIRRRAALWRRQAPAGPVIAAGSTGTLPATAALLDVIRQLPAGTIVLPGLDQALSQQAWQDLAPNDPQYALAQLLRRLGLEREAVKIWPEAQMDNFSNCQKVAQRIELLRDAMIPASHWPPPARSGQVDEGGKDSRDGITKDFALCTAETPQMEAKQIAIAMRESLQQPERTAALVTTDRRLARRVAIELQRWGIEVDDSAGTPLAATAIGQLIRLSAEFSIHELRPLPLLALLKHPLVAAQRRNGVAREAARRLDHHHLRGPRPAAGLQAFVQRLQSQHQNRPASVTGEQITLLRDLLNAAAPFSELKRPQEAPISLAALIEAHSRFLQWLGDDDQGESRLWLDDAGEAAAGFFTALAEAAAGLNKFDGADYAGMLDGLMADVAVRPSYGRHPRLFIWGPLEARLQQADRMILGALNEDNWPRQATPGPWLSRPMLAQLDLPLPETRIGQSAHDFMQAASAPAVLLTRSMKVDGQPSIETRWLSRLNTLMKAHAIAFDSRPTEMLPQAAAALDQPSGLQPIGRPGFAPPLAARPRQLSVTQIEKWMRDPYGLYAETILRLEPLDPLDDEPGAKERGTLIHQILAEYIQNFEAAPPTEPEAQFRRYIRKHLRGFRGQPDIETFWPVHLRIMLQRFLQFDIRHRQKYARPKGEVKGHLDFEAPAGRFRLTAKADRIDRALSGSGLAIIDYKSGSMPHENEVRYGFSPQLPLEALIAQAGGFTGITAGNVEDLQYWPIVSGQTKPVRKAVSAKAGEDPAENLQQVVSAAGEGLLKLVTAFDEIDTAYIASPSSRYGQRYNAYAHLERAQEWGGLTEAAP